MRDIQAARHYARAFFEVAEKQGALEAARDGLRLAVRALAGNPQALRTLLDPRLPAKNKRELAAVFAGKKAPVVLRNFLLLLIQRRRLSELESIAMFFEREMDAKQGVQRASLRSVEVVTPEAIRRLEERLAVRMGMKISVEPQVDPELLAGFVLKVGDRVLDGSLKGRLRQLRRQLLGAEV